MKGALSGEAAFSLMFVTRIKPSWDKIAAKAGGLVGCDACSSLGLCPGWKVRNYPIPSSFRTLIL